MAQDSYSGFALAAILLLFLAVRLTFTIIYREEKNINIAGEKEPRHEGKTKLLIRRLILIPLVLVVFLFYSIYPEWMRYLLIPFPLTLAWIGTVLGLSGLILLIWVHIYLGKEWSVKLQIKNEHRLIKTGPYSGIRHPMYTALFAIYLSFGILSLNYVVLILMVLIIISIALRIPDEEKMLTEKFGDEYRTYMQNTGRLFPKFL